MGSLRRFRKLPHPTTFGVEIECYPRWDALDTDVYEGFFYCTTDGSLRRSNGREYISQPLPYNMLVRQIRRLWKRGGWETDDDCGLHIHVSRHQWSQEREHELSRFLAAHKHHMTRWFGRLNRFARPDAEEYEKFRAINVCHKNSYEFRVWKAGDLNWTLEALRRTREIVQYRGKWSIEVMDAICKPEPEPVPVIQAANTPNDIVDAFVSTIMRETRPTGTWSLANLLNDEQAVFPESFSRAQRAIVNDARARRGLNPAT